MPEKYDICISTVVVNGLKMARKHTFLKDSIFYYTLDISQVDLFDGLLNMYQVF